LPWSSYPASLQSEVERYLAQSLTPDPLDPDAPAPVRPTTVQNRRQMLRQLSAARVRRGTPALEIRGLGDLVTPAALQDALRFFVDRAANLALREALSSASTRSLSRS
jgi:hypothetical protein